MRGIGSASRAAKQEFRKSDGVRAFGNEGTAEAERGNVESIKPSGGASGKPIAPNGTA